MTRNNTESRPFPECTNSWWPPYFVIRPHWSIKCWSYNGAYHLDLTRSGGSYQVLHIHSLQPFIFCYSAFLIAVYNFAKRLLYMVCEMVVGAIHGFSSLRGVRRPKGRRWATWSRCLKEDIDSTQDLSLSNEIRCFTKMYILPRSFLFFSET